ncbi:N,N-dimethylformamidase beta subunit family domain-containing protein [[Kitasatospora] papulosa]|uniref:N,N-dimethylformamidase beta subunit family domain-containing protein n=1 Tax=[Kitasatospora] papulosa TaxID=1464011 RepID=UPI003907EE48
MRALRRGRSGTPEPTWRSSPRTTSTSTYASSQLQKAGPPAGDLLQGSPPGTRRSRPDRAMAPLGKKHHKAEQRLTGIQYNGILAKPVPLVVSESKHWFWSGTGLRDGDEIPDLIAVEADGFKPLDAAARRHQADPARRIPLHRQPQPWARRAQHQSLREPSGDSRFASRGPSTGRLHSTIPATATRTSRKPPAIS